MEPRRSRGILSLVAQPEFPRLTLGRKGRLAVVGCCLVYAVVLLRTAWVSDDAYITFRTIDNFQNGHGLTWNVSERVQVFTHPLWALLLSGVHAYTKEFFFTCIVLSMILSCLTAVVVGFGISRSLTGAVLGVSILALSKAFVDYSTSGLENPLTHLLAALFCLIFFRYELDLRSLAVLSVVASLATLNRMDAILFFLPALAYVCLVVRRWMAPVIVGLGFFPFVLWEAFSLVYYGFLFPNSAYAKLYTGLSRWDLIGQGFRYLLDSLTHDPLTLVVVAAGLVASLLVGSRRVATIAAGAALSLVYVTSIGGDFMTGRFLSFPLLIGAILVSLLPFGQRAATAACACGLLVALAGVASFPTFQGGREYGQDTKALAQQIERSGISDERAFYYPVTGLFRANRAEPVPSPRQIWVDAAIRARREGLKVVVRDAVGFYGFTVGPDVHVVDQAGLGDALLARLPPVWRLRWRIGHLFRTVPAGYLETLATGEDHFEDSNLGAYYEKLSLIIRGDLFDRARWAAIVDMNLGRYNHWIDLEKYRFPDRSWASPRDSQHPPRPER